MKRWWYILFVILAVQCRNAYNVTPSTNGDGALVVEGILNANGRTTINLSRTTRLSDKRIAPESGASLVIQSEASGDNFPMLEISKGVYQGPEIIFSPADKYRLKIQTSDSREYATDFRTAVTSPVIDSITWIQSASGVNIFSNSRDDVNNNKYFKLDYEETWEFHSSYRATLHFVKNDDPSGYPLRLEYLLPSQSVDERLFKCYNNRQSTNINIFSTEALGTNVLYFQLRDIPAASIELSVLYSILVKQYALSQDGYEFFARMKKNTESLGSIFDAQPTELSGNVTSLTDPSELVIGFVECTTVETKRIFINNEELEAWGYDQGCKAYSEPNPEFSSYPYPNDPSLFEKISERGVVPTIPAETGIGGSVITWYANIVDCVDCRQRGSNVKPDFWP